MDLVRPLSQHGPIAPKLYDGTQITNKKGRVNDERMSSFIDDLVDLAEYLGQCPIVSPLPWSLHWASEHHRWICWYKDKPLGLYRFSSPKLGGSADFPKNQVILGSSPQLRLLCTPTSVVGRLLWLNQIKIDPLPILDTLGKVIGWAAFIQDTSEFPSLKSSAKSSNMFKVHYSSQGLRFITYH